MHAYKVTHTHTYIHTHTNKHILDIQTKLVTHIGVHTQFKLT